MACGSRTVPAPGRRTRSIRTAATSGRGFAFRNGRDAPPSQAVGRYPALGGSDVDCRDLGYAVWVDGPDPHALDADDDRVGCERYLGRPVPDSARLR